MPVINVQINKKNINFIFLPFTSLRMIYPNRQFYSVGKLENSSRNIILKSKRLAFINKRNIYIIKSACEFREL